MSELLEFHEHNDSTYYVGDLEAGKAAARANLYGSQSILERTHSNGAVSVEIHDGKFVEGDSSTLCAWGTSEVGDVEEAWRYLLGTEFGPLDSEYDEPALREYLDTFETGGNQRP
jgi:hypothetical protein